MKSERFIKGTCLQQDFFYMTMVTIMFDTKASESESFIDRSIERIINIIYCELRSEPRAAHVFFIFQIKKEYFIFMFQIKSISKVHLSQVVPSSQHHCGRDNHGHLLVQPVHLSKAPTPRLEAWRTS